MQRLLLIGDSYADEYLHLPNRFYSYHQALKQHYDVVNIGARGASLWYSYKQLKLHYRQGDIVLWMVTGPGRMSGPWGHASNYHDVNFRVELMHKGVWPMNEHIRPLEAIRDYMAHAIDMDYETYAQWAMLDRIKRKDLTMPYLLVPCFKESMEGIKDSLFDVFMLENTTWGIKDYGELVRKWIDNRVSHLTEENHRILAKKILDALNQGLETLPISVDEFVRPALIDKTRYLTRS